MATGTVMLDSVVEGMVSTVRPTLKQARVRQLLSANELGKMAGVAASTVLDMESGAKPRLSTIRRLAKALDMSPADIEWPGDPLGDAEPPGQDE